MNINTLTRLSAAGFLLPIVMAGAASAASVQVTITNEQGDGGVFLTPLVSIFHDGTFDTFDVGGMASNGVEQVAEEGDGGPILADVAAAGAQGGPVLGFNGFTGAPVIDPGETASSVFNVNESNRYFSYLSMIIPSNDLFIGNSNQMANEIFDAMGNFMGRTIEVYAANVYDAGTEENDNLGAAFNANNPTAATDTIGGTIGLAGSLFFLNGENTVAGTTINLPSGAIKLATITVSEVPLPAAAPLMLAALGGLGFAARRRR